MGKNIRWLLLGDAGLDTVKIINFEIPTCLLNAPCDMCVEMQMSGTETVDRRPMSALELDCVLMGHVEVGSSVSS
jgi:hypothetical protein